MSRKFKVGDKVRYKKTGPKRHLVPDWVVAEYRPRTRTVVGATFDPRMQVTLYELGGPGKSRIGYQFRSHQLVMVKEGELKTKGRPRTKKRRKSAGALPWRG